ncbi:hypothetical protein SO802_013971, partial [Lithocarpus litseifolius]
MTIVLQLYKAVNFVNKRGNSLPFVHCGWVKENIMNQCELITEVYFVLEQNFTHGCTFEKDLQKKLVHFIVAIKLAYRMTHERL